MTDVAIVPLEMDTTVAHVVLVDVRQTSVVLDNLGIPTTAATVVAGVGGVEGPLHGGEHWVTLVSCWRNVHFSNHLAVIICML